MASGGFVNSWGIRRLDGEIPSSVDWQLTYHPAAALPVMEAWPSTLWARHSQPLRLMSLSVLFLLLRLTFLSVSVTKMTWVTKWFVGLIVAQRTAVLLVETCPFRWVWSHQCGKFSSLQHAAVALNHCSHYCCLKNSFNTKLELVMLYKWILLRFA